MASMGTPSETPMDDTIVNWKEKKDDAQCPDNSLQKCWKCIQEIDYQMNYDECSQNVHIYVAQDKEIVHQTSMWVNKIKTVLCTMILIDLILLTC